MPYRLLIALLTIMALLPARAQEAADTIYNPPVVYAGLPTTYEIAGVRVTGADNYEDYIVIGYSGLKVGDRIEIPGNDITTAVKRLMRQGLFAQAQIILEKTAGDKAWLLINLRTQPRISEVRYTGMKNSEKKELQERLQLMSGNQITQNIVNRATDITKKYFETKGFGNADVKITLDDDLSKENEMIVTINVDKHSKVKVHKIYIDGNEVLSDSKLKRVIKKTNEGSNLWKIFSQKKFVEQDYRDDLERIIQKYNELGYRDAKILKDSVAPWDDNKVDVFITLEEGDRYYLSDITWVGNTIYNTDQLNYLLDMKPGDVYNQKHLDKRLTQDEDAVSSAYMDKGYLFFNVVPIEKNIHGDSIDLELRMMEGPQARVNKVTITGNDRLYEKVVRGYMDGAGANAYGFSFSDVVDGGVNVAPWVANGNRNFVYEGIVRGLDRK